MAPIKIEQEGMVTHISVDGVLLKGVLAANVVLEPSSLPTVEVRLAFTKGGMQFAEGCLKVGELVAPEELERALLDHLKAKYEVRLPVVSMGVDLASGPDMTAWHTVETTLHDRQMVWERVIAPFGLYKDNAQPAGEDPMEAARALVKKHGGGSGG